MNQLLLLNGPPGAGKSSVAEALCERYDRMLHVNVDALRHWVKAGYRRPWDTDAQAAEQRDMATRGASALAREALLTRYAVVIDDTLTLTETRRYVELLSGFDTPLQVVTLLPSLDVTLARDALRAASIPDRVRAMHGVLAEASAEAALPGAVLDTSADGDAYLTADRVQDLLARGAALVA